MSRRKPVPALCVAALLITQVLQAQQPDQPGADQRPVMSFAEYVTEVLRSNIDLSVQRSNISISQAQVKTATARPDWAVDFGAPAFDLSNQGFPTSVAAGLTVPIELGGKRGARVRAATADVSTVTSDYQDAVRQFRGTAAAAFVDALGSRGVLQSKNKSLAQLDQIVHVNEERLRAGDIGEIELVQSRVERDQFRADVISAESDVYSADLVFAQLLGSAQKLGPQMPVPKGSLEIPTQTFDLDQLVASALKNRSDLISGMRAVQAAEQRIKLAKANLVPDIAVTGEYVYTGTGTGDFLQSPDSTLGISASLNLPISRRRNPGELEAARATHTQAELQLQAVQLKVEVEVRDAYERYQASARRLNLFRGGLLHDADRVLEARLYAYQRGGTTLLEVIDAQRKSADVYLAYAQALTDHAHALVTLEASAAIWDVTF